MPSQGQPPVLVERRRRVCSPGGREGGGVILCGDLRNVGGPDALSSTIRRAVQPHSHLQMRRSNRPGGCGVHQDGGAPRPVQRERSTRVSGDLHGHPPTLLRITASGGENVPGTLIGRMAEGGGDRSTERATDSLSAWCRTERPSTLSGMAVASATSAVGKARGRHDALKK